MIKGVVVSPELEELVATAEGGESAFSEGLLQQAGISISAEVKANATKQVKHSRESAHE